MGPEDRQRADFLDQYWDSVVQHEPGTRAAEVDTVTATIISRLSAPPASPQLIAAGQRVRRAVSASARETAAGWSPRHERVVPDTRRFLSRAARRRPALTWARDLAAAVFLLAAGAAILFGVLRLTRGEDRHTGGPAIYAPATPSPEATPDDTVLHLTLPATALPTGDTLGAGLAVFTIAPGTRSSWDQTCCPGVLVEHVVAGQYSVRAEAAITIVRADQTVEAIPARTEVVLNPGDSLISRDEVAVEAANTGTEPVTLLSWLLIQGDGTFERQRTTLLWAELWPQFTGHKLPGWVEGQPGDVREMSDVQGPIRLDARPARIELRRVTVQDDTILPPPADGLQFIAPVGPHADKLRQADNTFRVLGEIGQPVTVYVLTLRQADP
jgi:hypothetical protein